MDSYFNPQARLGMQANNLMANSTYVPDFITRNRQLVEWMYRSSWIVGQAVDCVAEDMMREGFDLTSAITPDDIETYRTGWDALQLSQGMTDAIRRGRLYWRRNCGAAD